MGGMTTAFWQLLQRCHARINSIPKVTNALPIRFSLIGKHARSILCVALLAIHLLLSASQEFSNKQLSSGCKSGKLSALSNITMKSIRALPAECRAFHKRPQLAAPIPCRPPHRPCNSVKMVSQQRHRERDVATNAQTGCLETVDVPLPVLSGARLAQSAVVEATRPRVVVLGSGWASMSMIAALPADIRKHYDMVVVSPRNYFLYTPLLPAVAVGTLEEASVMEPVRKILKKKGIYYEALCKSVDPVHKEIVACFPGDSEDCFKIGYDILIMGVGSVNNTFGVQGVREHCQFFKTIEDAQRLRRSISECFERAALPNTSEEERQQLLSFVICGGGPTGVEVAAEMHDMIYEDLAQHYPQLMPDVKIRVIELTDHVLSAYDRKIGEFTAQQFSRTGIELVLNTKVASVSDGYVTVADKSGATSNVPFGACVWATGIAMNPLAKQLQEAFPKQQTHFRSILTDGHMRVLGSHGSIWAFGDAATIHQPHALDHADDLFDEADLNKDGRLSLPELQQVLRSASKKYSHLEEHARFLEAKSNRFGGLVCSVMSSLRGGEEGCTVDWHEGLTREEFRAVLQKVDSGLRALPATAQVAKQQGEFLAELLQKGQWDKEARELKVSPKQTEFKYFHKGSLAYVGHDKAVMDVPKIGPLSIPPLLGHEAGMLWRSYEVTAQISVAKKIRVMSDFICTKVFGRNFSNF